MTLRQPSESELRNVGSLKWSGIKSQDGLEPLGAWVAEMDFGTAPAVEDRLVKAIRDGLLGYPTPWAKEAMIQSVVDFQERRFGWVVKPNWVRGTQSVLTAFESTIAKLTKAGSSVIVPTPAYMPFLTIPKTLGREIVTVTSQHVPNAENPNDAWALDLEEIEKALQQGAGLLVLCNPWNPTGRVLSVPELRALNAVVRKYDALVFSDEIHAPLTYGDPSAFVSYASLGPDFAAHTITAVSASKAWNVPGLMAAQVIISDHNLRQRWDDLVPQTSATALGSLAAATSYSEGEEWLTTVLEQLSTNLNLLDEALESTLVDYSRPQGTYLTWLGFDRYDLSASPAKLLLEKYGVAVNDGKTLGTEYSNWVRVNAAMSEQPWKKTVEQIVKFAKDTPTK